MIAHPLICRLFFKVVILFLYIPIIILIVASFNSSRFGGEWQGFSLIWYSRLFQESAVWNAFANSLVAALSSACASTFLAISAALALYYYKSSIQHVHKGLIVAPLFIPDILMGISLLMLFVFLQFKLSLFTVFLAHTTFSISYVTIILTSKLDTLEYSLIEAAKDLGASRMQIFIRIVLPYIMPALIAGFLFAFTLSLDDFVITFFVVGPGATTLPIYIYSMMKFGSPPLINALSTILLTCTGAITLLSHYLTKEEV